MVTLRGEFGVISRERSLSRSFSESWAWTQGRVRRANSNAVKVFFMSPILKRWFFLATAFTWALGGLFPFSIPGQSAPVVFSDGLKGKAENGDGEAQFQLGNCYFFGLGVPKKQIDGVAWYRKAAEQGHPEAQFNLGGCLYQGYGVEPNQGEAVRWWRKSAGQNFPPALISLGDCYLYGRGLEKNEVEAVRWFQKAAEQDYPAALYRLGNCYLQGTGVDRDIVQAMRYYRKAADLKYPPAIKVLQKMEEGSGS